MAPFSMACFLHWSCKFLFIVTIWKSALNNYTKCNIKSNNFSLKTSITMEIRKGGFRGSRLKRNIPPFPINHQVVSLLQDNTSMLVHAFKSLCILNGQSQFLPKFVVSSVARKVQPVKTCVGPWERMRGTPWLNSEFLRPIAAI